MEEVLSATQLQLVACLENRFNKILETTIGKASEEGEGERDGTAKRLTQLHQRKYQKRAH